MLPPNLANDTSCALPTSEVRVVSTPVASSGRWNRCTGLSCVRRMLSRVPRTALPVARAASS
jgi:hypothetical protein